MAKINKKVLEFEMELAYDLKLAEDIGSDCDYALRLGLIEDYEHCGWCD